MRTHTDQAHIYHSCMHDKQLSITETIGANGVPSTPPSRACLFASFWIPSSATPFNCHPRVSASVWHTEIALQRPFALRTAICRARVTGSDPEDTTGCCVRQVWVTCGAELSTGSERLTANPSKVISAASERLGRSVGHRAVDFAWSNIAFHLAQLKVSSFSSKRA